MSEFSAFLAGLIIGDVTPSGKPKHSNVYPKKNIPLQDVIFCQALKNTEDRLEEFVRENHPTPEEFISYLLPKCDFEQPYTTAEQRQIADNEKVTSEYLLWIQKRVDSGELTGENAWENLPAVKMIWDDESHTPDFDNLDLLFGDSLKSHPIKLNGRVYEYDSYMNPFSGLAKGYFDGIASRIIRSLCVDVAINILSEEGFSLDFRRIENIATQDKLVSFEAQLQFSRREAYKLLLKKHKKFCGNPWSEDTRKLKQVSDYDAALEKVPQKTLKKRKKEMKRVLRVLTKEERKSLAANGRGEGVTMIAAYIFGGFWAIIAVFSIIVLLASMGEDFESFGKIWCYVLLFSIALEVLHLLIMAYLPPLAYIIMAPLLLLADKVALRDSLTQLQNRLLRKPRQSRRPPIRRIPLAYQKIIIKKYV